MPEEPIMCNEVTQVTRISQNGPQNCNVTRFAFEMILRGLTFQGKE